MLLEQTKNVLNDVLRLGGRTLQWSTETPLLGALPELDSFAVVGVLAALEQTFGIAFDDDEVSADNFATLGTLTTFIQAKQTQA